jgi:hypothetical protein
MTKEQQIAKYGIEWYEAYKAKSRSRHKERYDNDAKYREDKKTKCNAHCKVRYTNDARYREARNAKHNTYCKERYAIGGRIDLVENYDKAKADNFKGWHIHHKDEIRILPSGMIVIRTKEELIENERYYDCPPNELIWMRQSEHVALHNKFRTHQNT